MKWRTSCLVAFLVATWITGASLAHAVEYTFQTIDYPGASQTIAWDINDAGHIVGTYTVVSGMEEVEYGFLYDGTDYTTIAVPGASETQALGINNKGYIVGYYEVVSGMEEERYGFLYDGTDYTTIAVPGASETHAFGINDADQVIGMSNELRTFLFDGTNYTEVDVPISVIKNDINNAGQIAGTTLFGAGEVGYFCGFLYDGGHYIFLLTIGGSNLALGINDAGHIVGGYGDEDELFRYGFVDDGTNYTTIDVPDSSMTLAAGINNAGQIVGLYEDSLGEGHGFLASPVPLPGSILLLGSGLLGLGALSWKRKRG